MTLIELMIAVTNIAVLTQYVQGEVGALGAPAVPSGSNQVLGGGGNDAILGSIDTDVLIGSAGNDSLTTAGGNDYLFGDAAIGFGDTGADTFIITPQENGVSYVFDFNDIDAVDLSAFNLRFSDLGITQTVGSFVVGSGAVDYVRFDVNLGNGQEVRLLMKYDPGASPQPTLTADDFIGLQPEPVNSDPVAVGTIADRSVDEDATAVVLTAAEIAAAFADADVGDMLTFTLGAGAPSWLALDIDGNLVSTDPTQADVGNYSVTIKASDGNGGIDAMQTFGLAVNEVNDMPIANDEAVQLELGQSLLIDVRANDTDEEDGIPTGTVTIVGAPAHGTASVVDGKILYTADHDFTGITTLSYTVTDSGGVVSNVGMVTIGVEAPEGAIVGTSGNDWIFGRLFYGDNIYSLAGDDVVFTGLFGHDTVSGGSGDDDLLGGFGNDVMEGNEGNDWIRGGAGNDHLYGDAGNDELFGSLGNDVLAGGMGFDKLSGGIGADTFKIDANDDSVDRIKDWDVGAGDDKIDLSGHGLTFSALSIVKSGNQTTVSSASEGTIVILDGKHNLNASDFIF